MRCSTVLVILVEDSADFVIDLLHLIQLGTALNFRGFADLLNDLLFSKFYRLRRDLREGLTAEKYQAGEDRCFHIQLLPRL